MTDTIEPSKRLKPALLSELTDKHRQVAALLVHGTEGSGIPLSIAETASALKVRRAYIRDLLADPMFKAEMARAVSDARAAMAPTAVAELGSLVAFNKDSESAKDASIRLNAAKTILGEDAKGFSVNVQVNNQVNTTIRPGYVLDLSALKPKEPTIIEGNAE